jgi:hypothetical protein
LKLKRLTIQAEANPALQPGANSVTITAQNVGVTPPLVVAVTVSHVTGGPAAHSLPDNLWLHQ